MDKSEVSPKKENEGQVWSALSLAWQLGYTVAIPLVILALIGRLLDKKFGTSPWLLVVGIFLSLIISTIAVYYKTIKILGDVERGEREKKVKKL